MVASAQHQKRSARSEVSSKSTERREGIVVFVVRLALVILLHAIQMPFCLTEALVCMREEIEGCIVKVVSVRTSRLEVQSNRPYT